ncbi:MAG: hypothetical protein HY064_00200 [Bacteroidetes bacterium]|nr:hypothetical protein [Bacteroidota bacterium]
MRRIFFQCIFFIFIFTSSHAQKLDFIGLKGISFGMKSADMPDKTVILDSTSAYKDTAVYMRNTRCQTYFRRTQEMQLTGFTASSIQYEFCDGELEYVFIDVSGNNSIDSALSQLQKTFHKLGCKGKPLNQCTQLDASASGMRLIVNVDRKNQKMNFVLIPKAAR